MFRRYCNTVGTAQDTTTRIKKDMKHLALEEVRDFVTKYHTKFSTEVFLRKPTFFVSDQDLMEKMSPREDWEKLGEGSFSEVYRAKWLGVDVAVKASGDCHEGDPDVDEYVIHSNIRHPNIVNFFVASPNFIVMELMVNDTLDNILFTQSKRKPGLEVRKRWCSQIAMAVRYLHESGIVHSDIKPDNIMMDSSWNAKICDVGGGYFFDEHVEDKTYTGMYLPLTLHRGGDKNLGKSTDLYSMSVVLLCILSWEHDLYKLMGIPNFERRICESAGDREEVIQECLQTCLPNVYNLVQSYDISSEAKSFLFKTFAEPCKDHVTNDDIKTVIEQVENGCQGVDIGCLDDL